MKEFGMRYYVMVGVLAVATAPLFAQPTPAPMAPAMGKTISRAEVQSRVQTHFAKRDANRDGVLTSDELTKHDGHRGMKMRRHGDTSEHAMRDPNVAFDRIDANRDGSISRDEFARAREVRIEKRVIVSRDGQSGAMGAMRGMHHGAGGMMGAAALRMADANRDGRVTLAEATSGALRHFDMMDTNHDGRLTPEERRAGRGMMREFRQQRRAG
jgi:hypothetical protein